MLNVAFTVRSLGPVARLMTLVASGILLALGENRVVAIPLIVVFGALWVGQRRQAADRREAQLSSPQRLAITAAYCVMASTLVFRVRSSAEIASQPLDGAGLLRVAFDMAALCLAAGALAAADDRDRRPWPLPLSIFVCYVAVVPLGATQAVNPPLVLFRFFELVVALVTCMALHKAFRGVATTPLRFLLTFLWILVGSILVGVVLWPGLALHPARGGIWPFRLTGVVPLLTANAVGTIGLILFAAALGLEAIRRRAIWMASGLLLVLLAQYRTGYVAMGFVLGAWLFFHKRLSSRLVLFGVIAMTVLFVQSGGFHDAWYRGESESGISTLNSRTTWWSAALETTKRSPIVGTGLTSGTRYEVFAQLGRDTTSTLHSAWVEAYAGTGLLGLSFLLAAILSVVPFAVRHAQRRQTFPLLLLIVLVVRSVGGTSFELPGLTLLFFMIAVLLAIGSAGDEDEVPVHTTSRKARVEP